MSSELHDLIRRAHRTRRTRARIIVEDCLERLPHYQGLPEALLEEVHHSILHHLALLYRVTLESGRPLAADDLEFSRELARRRAAQGVPLGEFLTFFLVGLTHAWEHLIASAGDDATLRDQLLDRVSAMVSNQTQLMSALTEAYVEERERLSRFREQDLDDFVQLLLADQAMQNVVEARAKALGIALDERRAVAIFGPPAWSEDRSVGPDEVRRELAARLPSPVVWVGRSREGYVALIPNETDREALAGTVERLFGRDGRAGVGGPGRHFDGLRRSAEEALRALRIGLGLRGPERVHRYADVAVLDLVGVDSDRAGEFVRGVLGSLVATRTGSTLLETLRRLCANNYRIKLAAAELGVHPHTLAYRLKQMRRRFDLDLDDPEMRLRVQLALRILDARSEE